MQMCIIWESDLGSPPLSTDFYVLLVWGCFSWSGQGLAEIKGNLNATPYNDVHKARFIKEWFSQLSVEKLDWPAQSSDPNPIPHLWDELECQLLARPCYPTSVADHWFSCGWMGENPFCRVPKSCRKPSLKSWGYHGSILMPMVLELDQSHMHVAFRCPNTFGHMCILDMVDLSFNKCQVNACVRVGWCNVMGWII